MAQLVEHCSANTAEAMRLNLIKIFFRAKICNCLNSTDHLLRQPFIRNQLHFLQDALNSSISLSLDLKCVFKTVPLTYLLLPQISCSGGKRGIYLRESHQMSKPFSESVSVTTIYNEDVGEFRE